MSYKIYAGTQTDVGVWDTKACIYDPSARDAASNTQLLISPTLTREAGTTGNLEFTIPLGNIAHSALQKLKTVVEVEQDGKPLWRGRVMSHDMDFYLRQKVYCEGELGYLNDTSLKPYRYKSSTIPDFLEAVLENHNDQTDAYKKFELGYVTVTPTKDEQSFELGYVLNCTVGKSYTDDDDTKRYPLISPSGEVVYTMGSGGRSMFVGATQRTYKGPYLDSGATTCAITKTSNTTYDVALTVVKKDGVAHDLSISAVSSFGSASKIGEYSVGDVSTHWRITSDGSVEHKIDDVDYKDDESSGTVGVWKTYPDVTFRQYSREKLSFGDGKNFGTTWDILQSELVDVYGGYLTVRYSEDGKTRYLDYLAEPTEQNEQTVEFGVNMLDLDNYVKAENIVTRVIAVGYEESGWWIFKSTKTISATEDDTAAQKNYGIITKVIVVDGTSSTKAKLQKAAQKELKKYLYYTDGMTISAIDLRDAGIDTERLGWMKDTHIISQPHGLDTWLMCTKVVEPLDAPDKKKFTFGTEFYSISDLQALSSRKASSAYGMALSTAGYINSQS